MRKLHLFVAAGLFILLTAFLFLPDVFQAEEIRVSNIHADHDSRAVLTPVNFLLGAKQGSACDVDTDCNDGDICTLDSCSGGVCANTPVENCRLNPLESSLFYAGFESGSIDADVGSEFAQTSFSDFLVLANPAPSSRNQSNMVLKAQTTNQGNIRAEYHAQRLETDEKTYIYAWKEFVPSDFFADKNINWVGIGQWKTWPCEDGSVNEEYKIYSDLICPGAGIFNHRLVFEDPLEQEFMFRAEPDCESYHHDLGLGAWHAYVLEIYWTNTDQGFYNLHMDGVLVKARSQLKTLFDQFPADGSCNMYWGMGIYASWSDAGAGILEYYLDDMAVFDVADGITVEQVLAWQKAD